MSRAIATKLSAHFTSAVMAGVFAMALKRQYAAVLGDLSATTPDALIFGALIPASVFAAIFGLGHFVLRQSGLPARTAYSALGLVALLVATGVSVPNELYQTAIDDGVLSILVLLTAGTGSIIGFLHVRSAGHEYDDDESHQLDASAANSARAAAGGQTQGAAGLAGGEHADTSEIGHVTTQSDEFFDGPLQVVTSGKAVVIAAAVGGVAHAFYTMLVMLVFSDAVGSPNSRLMEQLREGEIFSMIGGGLIFSMVICMLVLPLAIFGLHKLLQSRNRISTGDYAKAGAIAPIAVGLAMLVVGIFLTHWFILPLAVAMAAYRKLAGLEPADLPEDIEVRDRRTLVSSDHVRRRTHRIVG